MLLGNCINGISLALNSLFTSLVECSREVELLLSFGATNYEATARLVQEAVRNGTMPQLNSMAIIGLISIPGKFLLLLHLYNCVTWILSRCNYIMIRQMKSLIKGETYLFFSGMYNIYSHRDDDWPDTGGNFCDASGSISNTYNVFYRYVLIWCSPHGNVFGLVYVL